MSVFKKLVDSAVREKVGTSRLIDRFNDAYDYIIVGAGAAGNVLANRLTADGSNSVLLLEAGGDDAKQAAIHMPVAAPELQQNKDYNYQYTTQPQQKSSQHLKDQQILYPRGKGLGGSGSINYMAYMRGSRYDYDEWAELGCKGWSYRDVLPYFIKSEDNANRQYVKSGYHGKGGPMKVRDLKHSPLVDSFLEAGKELGYSIVDPNGPEQIGFGNVQANINEDGLRWSTAHGYLRPAMTRDNLHVAVKSQVRQILFYENQATGVEVTKEDRTSIVKARKEVILSAGAVESPKLLMLSGIGPQHHLSKFKIPVRNNKPVGYNLQDHPTCVMEYTLEMPPVINVESTLQNPQSKEYQQYLFFTKGYLGMAGPQGGLAYFRTPNASHGKMYPDILLQMSTTLSAAILRKTWNLKDSVWQDLYENTEGRPGIFLTNLLLHPQSAGFVHLKSTDPYENPLIDPCFLKEDSDAKTLIEGVKMKLKLGETQSFKKMGARVTHRLLPGYSPTTETEDDSVLADYVRHHTLTGHHACGTCKMGASHDPTAVVDPELKVIGMQGLRVVDASVMPKVPSGPTSAPTIMIAEKAADIILGSNSVDHIKLPEGV